MKKYKILFVDEVAADIRRFQRYVKNNDSDKDFELIVMTPENTLDNFLNEIKDEKFDAIITDHRLYEENANISFNGLDLVKAILGEKINFPCFVLTSFDDEAVADGEDVNIVYTKSIMSTDVDKRKKLEFIKTIEDSTNDYLTELKKRIFKFDDLIFLDKIKNQILHYRKRIQEAENELLELVKKPNKQDLNAEDEARLQELDTFIEQSSGKKSSLPKHLKGTKNLDALHKLIESTDELLKNLNQNNSDNASKP